MSKKSEMIELWKEKNVHKVDFEFDCGGDNMGDTSIKILGENEEEIECQELVDYFDNVTYDNVHFYVNSDGHYQGEFGHVYITYDKDDDDFVYEKYASSEWSERYTATIPVELTDEQALFISEKVLNIMGNQDESGINYKIDFILKDADIVMVEELQTLFHNTTADFDDFQADTGDEESTWWNYTTGNLNGNTIELTVEKTYNIISEGIE